MAGLLSNFRNTVIVSVILALIVLFAYSTGPQGAGPVFWQGVFRWMHVFFGILWIGLLYYFNFVQIRKMPDIPAELKPAVSKYIAPEALFWFRWAALATVVTGLLLALMNGYILQALGLQKPFHAIGIGMWLALVMAFNVWFIIWPMQQKALGLVQVSPEEKAAAARKAMLTSRLNTMLSIPMLFCMVAQQNGGL
jgi:uncharacterized membrane protein